MLQSQTLPWYDSLWLGKYLAAKELIALVAPGKTAEFVRAFDPLRTAADFSVRRFEPLLPPDALDALRHLAAGIPREDFELHELGRFGRLVVHNYPAFAPVHAKFAEFVSDQTGEAVEPAYNFFAMYTRKGLCEPHLDAPSAKWTLDLCLGQSEPWPIQFSQIVPWPEERMELSDEWQGQIKSLGSLHYESATLRPGDAVLFSGSSQWHYRDAMPGRSAMSFCDLLFLHYIPKGTAELVEPSNWAGMFGVPELRQIRGIEKRELSEPRRAASAAMER